MNRDRLTYYLTSLVAIAACVFVVAASCRMDAIKRDVARTAFECRREP